MSKRAWKRRVTKSAVMALATIALVIAIAYPPIQRCIQEREGGNPVSPYPEHPSLFFRLHTCGWEFLADNHDAILALATIALVVGTLFLALYTRQLWTTTLGMANEAKESAREQSERMQASVREAVRSADAMEASVKQARTATAVQGRAYLSVVANTALYQERKKNLRFEIKPLLINSGKTPAHKITYSATTGVLPTPLPPDYPLPTPTKRSTHAAVLGPGQNFVLNSFMEEFVPDARVDSIKSGLTEAVFIWGTVNYDDVFGEPHFTRFCHSVSWLKRADGKENMTANYAQQHNEAN